MGGSWAKRPVLKKTGCNRSTTGLLDFWQTGQVATGLITIDCNWQLQSSCNQLQSSPVSSLCTSCQLDFKTLPPRLPQQGRRRSLRCNQSQMHFRPRQLMVNRRGTRKTARGPELLCQVPARYPTPTMKVSQSFKDPGKTD